MPSSILSLVRALALGLVVGLTGCRSAPALAADAVPAAAAADGTMDGDDSEAIVWLHDTSFDTAPVDIGDGKLRYLPKVQFLRDFDVYKAGDVVTVRYIVMSVSSSPPREDVYIFTVAPYHDDSPGFVIPVSQVTDHDPNSE